MRATLERLKGRLQLILIPFRNLLRENLFVIVGGVIIFGFIIIFFGVIPLWRLNQNVANYHSLKEYHELKNAARATFAQALGGAALLIGLYFTWRNLMIAQKGQITDRFTRAINQLGESGPEKLTARLGGIYALEQIAKDSEEYYWPTMEVLTAYVRENAPWPPQTVQELNAQNSPSNEDSATIPWRTIAADIQAILDIIGRRVPTSKNREVGPGRYLTSKNREVGPIRCLDLHNTNLSRLIFNNANLAEMRLYSVNLYMAHLGNANLSGTDLSRANLSGAILGGANLSGAFLFETNLSGANLAAANLSGAFLGRANLSGAFLFETNLSGADLTEADLTEADPSLATGLTPEQIKSASTYKGAKLPDDLKKQLEES